MARIANLAMMEFAIIRAFPFPHPTAAFALREKNGAATSFQSFCKYFAGAFYCRLCAWQDMFEAFRQGKNRSKSRFILRGRRKKFPNANPKAESSPNHFDFPVISYYFPPFSVSKLLGNVGRQIRAARLSTERERWNFSRSARFFAAAEKIFLSARQGFCSPLGALKIRAGGGEAFFWGRPVLLGKKLPFARRKKRAARIRNRLLFFFCCA